MTKTLECCLTNLPAIQASIACVRKFAGLRNKAVDKLQERAASATNRAMAGNDRCCG